MSEKRTNGATYQSNHIGRERFGEVACFLPRRAGLPTQVIVGAEFEDGAVVFFEMNGDLILVLSPRTSLAKDAKIPLSSPSPSDLWIRHIVASEEEVDAIMQLVESAGAISTDPAHHRFWRGCSRYF